MDDVNWKIEVQDASTLLEIFFKDIECITDPVLCNTHPEGIVEAKNRVSDFISNYGDSLFMVDVEEVSGKTLFLRRSLFEITKEDKSRISVFMNMLNKHIVIATINEKNDQGVDAQFVIRLRSLVSQVCDRFCVTPGGKE